MMTIWKYELEIKKNQIVQMPIGASILSVDNVNDNLCLWAVVDPNTSLSDRVFEIVGTGFPFPTGLVEFAGTVVIKLSVWHVFERIYE